MKQFYQWPDFGSLCLYQVLVWSFFKLCIFSMHSFISNRVLYTPVYESLLYWQFNKDWLNHSCWNGRKIHKICFMFLPAPLCPVSVCWLCRQTVFLSWLGFHITAVTQNRLLWVASSHWQWNHFAQISEGAVLWWPWSDFCLIMSGASALLSGLLSNHVKQRALKLHTVV